MTAHGPQAPAAASPTPSNLRAPLRARDDGRIVALLGPTNTGKTHFAIERMLGHSSGMIGLPLRLLAREVYDKILAQKGPARVALITGEEKIVPARPSYWVCTVESMPVDIDVDFLAVDEIQLAADPDRGHIFTDRLLRARGRHETMFMGAGTIKGLIQQLLPNAEFLTRTRMSRLSFAGSKKLSRLPRRSAIVAFSASDVYAIAELIRRRKGGAAVVMGALSPRTRNAQVAMYQNGEVDYIVATDAIGMGLNMAINHVAFAALSKFDGMRQRRLFTHEIAQIAGRAGRHMNDGTFGLISDGHSGAGLELSQEEIEAIEDHRFKPLDKLQWRNAALDYSSLDGLIRSLEASPDHARLSRAPEAVDLAVLKMLASDESIRANTGGPAALKLLWQACQIPDFRKTMVDEHARLVGRIFRHLSTEEARLPESWVAGQVDGLDRADGDIDTIANRIAHIRTWTYIANRADWLEDPAHWRERTREIEDRLSDALHERLTQRFVDKRTSVLMKRLQGDDKLVATVDASSDVLVEGHYVGRLTGLSFEADEMARGQEGAVLMNAAARALRRELDKRVAKIQQAEDTALELDVESGEILFDDAPIAKLTAGPSPLEPQIEIIASEFVEPASQQVVRDRLAAWLERDWRDRFAPLLMLRDSLEKGVDEKGRILNGLARGIAFQLLENLGSMPREGIRKELKSLSPKERWQLRGFGVRFAEASIYMPLLLKPAFAKLRLLAWSVHHGLMPVPEAPPPGLTSVPREDKPDGYYEIAGFREIGQRAVRIDMLERVAEKAREKAEKGPFEVEQEMMSVVGCTGEDFAAILKSLGYKPHTRDDGTVVYERKKPGKRPPRRKQQQTRRRQADSPFAELEQLKRAMRTG